MEMVEYLYQSLKRDGTNIKKSMETANIMKMDGNYMETVENPLPSCKLYGNDMETIWKRFGKDPHRRKWKFYFFVFFLNPNSSSTPVRFSSLI